ncbi:MAG: Ldh family oxidoreductase [Deltaproteobacteria bacterium]|jgi:L-2-hydroxycarboxylate dehydrogenase (NAD+)|nr:Ldh family oxidoreductase [Deltaproteobacteria bacterium]
MAAQVVLVPVDTIKNFIKDVLMGIGVPADDAEICQSVLIASDLKGIDSHGVGRLKMYYDRIKDGIQQPTTNFEIVKETETTAVIDGHHGMGHVVGVHSMQMAIDMAGKFGLGAVAVRNSTHYGIAGYYPEMAIENNMIGLTFTNARPSVAPTYGVEPMLGTNPLTFGCPTDEDCSFVIDCATSISQRGKIELYDRAEKDTPEGVAIDDKGNPHTDTKKLLKDLVSGGAALLPMGGATEELGSHKGYGWSVMAEILCAALQDGSYMKGLLGFDDEGNRAPYKLGHFFLAINIENFLPVELFKKIAGNICRELRASKRVEGEPRIYTAGEKEFESEKVRMKDGIPINKNLQKNLIAMRDELGLLKYKFPF